jgi:hypothetical protein
MILKDANYKNSHLVEFLSEIDLKGIMLKNESNIMLYSIILTS